VWRQRLSRDRTCYCRDAKAIFGPGTNIAKAADLIHKLNEKYGDAKAAAE
jgi:hypothetical protein